MAEDESAQPLVDITARAGDLGKRSKSMDATIASTPAQQEFFDRAAKLDLAPFWRVATGLVAREPRPRAAPHVWKYSDVRPYLIEATELVTAAEAERRVLILENPALPGESRIADSLFAGFQIIMPDETAPVHRHTASALRFIIEGSKAYTAVNGERTMMLPGDFVTTPSWTWHDHANCGDEPMVWLDGLDMHIVNLLNTSFRDELPEERHTITRPDDSSVVEFGSSMMPASYKPSGLSSPVLNYPFVRTKAALESLCAHEQIDEWRGHVLNYLNPLSGDWALPTIATCMRKLPAGMTTRSYRSTDTTVFVVVEGTGSSKVGSITIDWSEHDVFVAPSWFPQTHFANSDAILFSYSDRAAQEKLGLWREERN